VLAILVLLGLGAFVVDRAAAAPDLGAPPAGPDDGGTQTAIAARLAAQMVADFASLQPHAVVRLSEQDLTVLAAEHNPHPDRYRNLEARVRDGLIAVSAQTSVGPLTVTVVPRILVSLEQPGRFTTKLVRLDVGQLQLPGWVRDRVAGTNPPELSLDPLFRSLPALQLLQADLECLRVRADGLYIGVHRPDVAADPSVCGG
jgi:hypothetical protein